MFYIKKKALRQAKEFYKSMGCSHFHMAREHPQEYKKYQTLKISSDLERDWKKEQFNDYYNNLMEKNTSTKLWIVHSNMAELAEFLRTENEIIKMLRVTELIKYDVSIGDRVIVSETINGRKSRQCRSGLIYLAYDSNNKLIAKEFVGLSVFYATYEDGSRDYKRCQRSIELCQDIKNELGL